VIADYMRIGEFSMVEAEGAQEGSVKVVNAHNVMDGAVTEIVGGAMDVAALEAAASQPKGEPVAVVVAAIFALGDGQAAEFTGPEDDGVVEETALFEIEDEGGAGLVGHFAEAAKS